MVDSAHHGDDETRRDALARSLCARICRADRTEDELRVVDVLLEGIERGFAEHGGLRLDIETRDFTDELDQELCDGLFYICARAAKRRAERLERLRCDAADEIEAAQGLRRSR